MEGNSQDIGYFDSNWVDSPIDQLFMFGYYVFCGGDSVLWNSRNHNICFIT